jgi:hypothetical protein
LNWGKKVLAGGWEGHCRTKKAGIALLKYKTGVKILNPEFGTPFFAICKIKKVQVQNNYYKMIRALAVILQIIIK